MHITFKITKYKVMDRPYVAIVSGATIDGKISLGRNVSAKECMPLPEDVQKYLHSIRAKFDAIMVGCNTIRTDNPHLTVRLCEGKNPIRVIPCTKLDLPLTSNIFKKDAHTIIATTEEAPKEKVEEIKSLGVDVLYVGKEKVEIGRLLGLLWKRGIKSLLVEGGSRLNWELIKLKVVDEIVLFIHPLIFGGERAPSLVEGEGFSNYGEAAKFQLTNFFAIDGFLISHWKSL